MQRHSTAILLFSRRAAAEAKHKSWTKNGNARQDLRIAETLIQESLRQAQATGLPVYHFHEGKQQGRNFGERLAHAFDALFQKGYDSVVAIGNDAPGLRKVDWQAVQTALAAGKEVIGRTVQGGAYLIGLQVSQFDRSSFEALPWESEALGHCLESSLHAVFALPVLHELNGYTDLMRWAAASGYDQALVKMLLAFVRRPQRVIHFLSNSYFTDRVDNSLHRGPPRR